MALSKRDINVSITYDDAPVAEEITSYYYDYFTTSEDGLVDSPVVSGTSTVNVNNKINFLIADTDHDTLSVRIVACNANECGDISAAAHQVHSMLRGPDVPSTVGYTVSMVKV